MMMMGVLLFTHPHSLFYTTDQHQYYVCVCVSHSFEAFERTCPMLVHSLSRVDGVTDGRTDGR